MHVKPKRYRCVTQLIDTIHGLQAAGHTDLVNTFPERPYVGDHIYIAGFGVLFAIVNELLFALQLGSACFNFCQLR
ncbi:hypothetical protein D3C76_1185430 [compost metagenome]